MVYKNDTYTWYLNSTHVPYMLIVNIHNLGNCIVPIIQMTTHPTVKVRNCYPLEYNSSQNIRTISICPRLEIHT